VPFARTISEFFQRGSTVGLQLPDGWYGGRPMENQHVLTLALDRPGRLIVELDEHILLTFTGSNLSVEDVVTEALDRHGTPAVAVNGYRQAVLDVRLYGSDETTAKVYRDGPVLFVSPA
jgi:hypothetical protein